MAGGAPTFRIVLYGHALDIAHGSAWNDRFWQDAASGKWERDTLDFVVSHLSPETVVLDIGAWIGPITLLASKRVSKVIAVEPDPVARAQLEDSVTRNAPNVTVVAGAVGAERGTLTLYAKKELGDSETSALAAGGTRIDVPMITLDDLLAKAPADAPLFVKMDIEGSEYRIVAPLTALLSARRGALHLSVHPRILAQMMGAGKITLAARFAALRQTMVLVRDLAAHGTLKLWGGNPSLPVPLQLFSWIMLRKRVKNFTLTVEP